MLLIDDDSELLKSAKQILELKYEIDIDLATSTNDATQKMVQKEYSVIVCDIQMPKTDGFEFLKILRKNGNKTPFIVFTVTDDKETALKAFRLGANGFVGKSGKPEAVFSTLAKCIYENIQKQTILEVKNE